MGCSGSRVSATPRLMNSYESPLIGFLSRSETENRSLTFGKRDPVRALKPDAPLQCACVITGEDNTLFGLVYSLAQSTAAPAAPVAFTKDL